MSELTIRPGQILLVLITIAGGLLIDTKSDLVGQMAVSAAVWAVLCHLLSGFGRAQRLPLVVCLLIATLGEMVLSLVFGLYTYRLGNIPLFVPPGHVLLFLLGVALAGRMSEAVALAVLAGAAAYSLIAAASGFDTFGVALFVLLAAASMAMPRHRRLYASTFLIALALELYGTWLGNWTWDHAVAGAMLVTTNPPAAAGAFYSVLDALVAVAASVIMPALMPAPCRAEGGGR